jgi:gamma-glutamylcyclotransferase (GGCT)/AIG2-like uncharacterized protein YtfP
MPRRLIDGEGVWRSEKIARLPARWKAEYANLIALQLDDGCFEADPRLVWSAVYSFNRREVSERDVAELLDEMEAVKLIFRWVQTTAAARPYERVGLGAAAEGKLWAYLVGSDWHLRHIDRSAKEGRLLPPSKRRKLGPGVPRALLRAFLASTNEPPQMTLNTSA